MRSVTILGSTGSIGTQALDVVRRNSDRFRVVGLGAATSHELLVGQVREFMPPVEAMETLARESEADMVLNAMVGAVGLGPSLAALQSGKMLALANKESLVVGG